MRVYFFAMLLSVGFLTTVCDTQCDTKDEKTHLKTTEDSTDANPQDAATREVQPVFVYQPGTFGTVLPIMDPLYMNSDDPFDKIGSPIPLVNTTAQFKAAVGFGASTPVGVVVVFSYFYSIGQATNMAMQYDRLIQQYPFIKFYRAYTASGFDASQLGGPSNPLAASVRSVNPPAIKFYKDGVYYPNLDINGPGVKVDPLTGLAVTDQAGNIIYAYLDFSVLLARFDCYYRCLQQPGFTPTSVCTLCPAF